MPGETILVVERNQSISNDVLSSLIELGFGIAGPASTGIEAVRIARETKPELIIVEVHSSEMTDEIAAASLIRSETGIPLIIIADRAGGNLPDQSISAKPECFLTKPFSSAELKEAIKSGMNKSRSEKQTAWNARYSTEMRYRSLFENATQGIFCILKSGQFVDVNASFAKALGYDSPQNLLEMQSAAASYFIDPSRHQDLMKGLRHHGSVTSFEFEACRKNGTQIWLSLNAWSVLDPKNEKTYYEGTIHDITKRKASDQVLNTMLARQTALLAAIPDIIVELDINGVYKWANSAGFNFFGNDLIGRNSSHYFCNSDEMQSFFMALSHDENKTISIENRQRRKDGAPRLLAWRCHGLKGLLGDRIGMLLSARDITDSKHAEEELSRAEERFRQIAEYIDEVFWVFEVEGKRADYISPAFDRVWGFSREELYKDSARFLMTLHPDDRDRFMQSLSERMSGHPFELEFRIVRSDGASRYIWNRGFPVADETGGVKHYVGVAQDITEWRNAEKDLQKSKEYLDQIINNIGDLLYVKDRQHRYLLVNEAVCTIFGRRRDEMIGRTLKGYLTDEMLESIHLQEDRVFETGEPEVGLHEIMATNGRVKIFMSHKTRFADVDGNERLIGVLRDITDIKKAEKERTELEIQLRQAQKLEAIGQLAAGIAHEINTPTQYVSDNTRFVQDAFHSTLDVLHAYEQLLEVNRKGEADSQRIEAVDAAIEKADLPYLIDEVPKAISQSLDGLARITTIVRAMKEFSHPGGEEKQIVDLNHAIENTVTVCRNEWKYVADVDMDLDPAMPSVPCLPGEFNQVILNLVVNAAHAIEESANGDRKNKGTIRISTRHDGDWVEIRIGDTGTGIPESNRAKIFTPFFTTKKVGKGTGQGLAISHSVIVGKHNGTIDFTTEVGKGTVFIIRLPIHA